MKQRAGFGCNLSATAVRADCIFGAKKAEERKNDDLKNNTGNLYNGQLEFLGDLFKQQILAMRLVPTSWSSEPLSAVAAMPPPAPWSSSETTSPAMKIVRYMPADTKAGEMIKQQICI